MALSKEEAVFFLRDVLEVPQAVLSNQQPSVSFLNEILKSYRNVVPWQSVTSWALPPAHRHLPIWEEVKERQFAKEGGMCYENNLFMKELLTALDFDVVCISCDFFIPDDHMTIFVRGLTGPSSKHWVDAGVVLPMQQAIQIDFETDSVEYDISFLRYKLVMKNGILEWHYARHYPHLEGTTSVSKDDEWKKVAILKVDKPCDASLIFRMTDIYTNIAELSFFEDLRALIFKEGRLIAIKGMQLMMKTKDRGVEKREMENTEEVVQTFKTYFPQISIDLVRTALNNTITNKLNRSEDNIVCK